MSTEQDFSATERDKLVSMMADHEVQFEKFRETTNARLGNLERARTRRSSSFFEMDFEKVIGLGLVCLFAMVLTRVLIAALAMYAAKKGKTYGGLPVSET